jgi:hypothetical protein
MDACVRISYPISHYERREAKLIAEMAENMRGTDGHALSDISDNILFRIDTKY